MKKGRGCEEKVRKNSPGLHSPFHRSLVEIDYYTGKANKCPPYAGDPNTMQSKHKPSPIRTAIKLCQGFVNNLVAIFSASIFLSLINFPLCPNAGRFLFLRLRRSRHRRRQRVERHTALIQQPVHYHAERVDIRHGSVALVVIHFRCRVIISVWHRTGKVFFLQPFLFRNLPAYDFPHWR